MPDSLSEVFVSHAAEILGILLGAADMIRRSRAYAVEYNVTIPHTSVQYESRNKRTALAENIMAFEEPQRYRIIKELCEIPSIADRDEVEKLKMQLITRYSHLADTGEVNEDLVNETRHWLSEFPDALSPYTQAVQKYQHGAFQRNILDDLRLALEILVRTILQNDKSLENQLTLVGGFLKDRGGSPEFRAMFGKLIEYYTKYQNSYVKHDDAVIEEEIEFIFELTSSFMKHLIRLARR